MPTILTAERVFPGPDDVLFRQSPRPAFHAAVWCVVALLALALVAETGFLPWPLALLAAVFVAFFLALSLATLRRARAPDSWLLACDGARVLVRTRSYLERERGDAGWVVWIPHGEIAAVREARLDTRGRDRLNEAHDRSASFLELELRPGIDLGEVAERLSEERRRRHGATWRHYPLSVAGAHTLRVEWRSRHARTTPPLEEALRVLSETVRVEAATRETLDLGGPGRAPHGQDTMSAVRTLAVQGRVIEATLLAERALGLRTADAKALVERLGERAD